MIIVSACLTGVNCRYHGGNSYVKEIAGLVSKGKALPVCPEQLGGFSTPRSPAEIESGDGQDVLAGKSKVVDIQSSKDLSQGFLKGAQEVLKIAQLAGCKRAILKDKSPSCGSTRIYQKGSLINGVGVTAALLQSAGITVESEGKYLEDK